MSAYKEKTLSLEKEMVKEILEDGTYREDILFKKTLQREANGEGRGNCLA